MKPILALNAFDVNNAATQQLNQLNTHSRYLHRGIIDCAERLLATLLHHLVSALDEVLTPAGRLT